MTTSVIVTTFNGEKYIDELLISLNNQTQKPEEVLFFDDGSNDKTIEIISSFIKNHNLNNWKIFKNQKNKGWIKNFHDALLEASGEVVFPCDQDDIWKHDKIQTMVSIMERENHINLLCSDYKAIYEQGGKKVDVLRKKKDILEKVGFSCKFSKLERPGCVMAIRKSFMNSISCYWLDWFPHDAFFWTISTIFDSCYMVHMPLIFYRRHQNNASTNSRRFSTKQIDATKRTMFIVEELLKAYEFNDEKRKILQNFLLFGKTRISLLSSHKIKYWFKIFKYLRFYRSWKQYFGDLYYIISGK